MRGKDAFRLKTRGPNWEQQQQFLNELKAVKDADHKIRPKIILSEIATFTDRQFQDLHSDTIKLMRKRLKPEQAEFLPEPPAMQRVDRGITHHLPR